MEIFDLWSVSLHSSAVCHSVTGGCFYSVSGSLRFVSFRWGACSLRDINLKLFTVGFSAEDIQFGGLKANPHGRPRSDHKLWLHGSNICLAKRHLVAEVLQCCDTLSPSKFVLLSKPCDKIQTYIARLSQAVMSSPYSWCFSLAKTQTFQCLFSLFSLM